MEEFMKTLPGPMQINQTFVLVFLLFITLYWLLRKFFVEDYSRVIEERNDIIEGAERKYSDAEVLFKEKLEYIEKEIAKARKNANSLRDRLVADAVAEKDRVVTGAKNSAKELVEKYELQLAKEIEEEKKKVEPYINNLANDIAQKMLGRKIS